MVKQIAAGYKKFDGKLYERETTVWAKGEAKRRAADLRRRGFNTRIVSAGKGMWVLYVRNRIRRKP